MDTSFNGTGIATEDILPDMGGTGSSVAPSTQIGGIAVQSDGKIILTAGSAESGLSAARFNADGSLDTSYGDAGLANYPMAMGVEFAAALQSDDSLLVVGSPPLDPSSAAPATFDIVRLNTDGSLDSTFGGANQPVVDTPIVTQPIAVPVPVISSPTLTTTAQNDPTQAVGLSQPLSSPPVIMTAQVATLSAPAITLVTNPPASTPAISVQQLATPAAIGGSSSDDPFGTAADSQASDADDLENIGVNLAAVDLALSLAGN